MKPARLLPLLFLVLFISCKIDKKPVPDTLEPTLSLVEKVALANGFEHWKDVQELRFTFNLDRDSSHFERSWVWKIPSGEVTGISLGDTATYIRKKVDSLTAKVDAAFINDKYWLLAPFNLVWDRDNFSFDHKPGVEAPMSKKTMDRLTIVYGNEGGYTPGDAYDFYLDENSTIREWVFRKSNQEEPSMITSWENYNEVGGLNLCKMHQNADGNFKLYFTNVEVVTK